MSSLEQRLAAITGTAASLKAQLYELERLREQIRKALLSAEKSRNRNGGMGAVLSHWKSTVPLPAATE
jgi:chromosome segregation ATPase